MTTDQFYLVIVFGQIVPFTFIVGFIIGNIDARSIDRLKSK